MGAAYPANASQRMVILPGNGALLPMLSGKTLNQD